MTDSRFDDWLASLPIADREFAASRHAEIAFNGGAYVLAAGDRKVAIPPVFYPGVYSPEARARLSADARTLLEALCRLTAQLMTDDTHAKLRERLFSEFTPLEREGVEKTWRAAENLATARVDYLVDEQGKPRALEMNATIPAMQGYSDAISEGFIRAVGQARGLQPSTIDQLVADNGRNADDLLASLYAHFQRVGGRAKHLHIAIIAREKDSQTGELLHYQKRWTELGHHITIATPEQVGRAPAGPTVGGKQVDLIYRHVFARRLERQSELALMLLEPEKHRIFNPMATHLELKAMLAMLSAAANGDGPFARLALAEAERETIGRVVPWSRILTREPGVAPNGEKVKDLVEFVAAHPEQFVIKRSWDYGGRGVFLGSDLPNFASQLRARQVLGVDDSVTVEWRSLVEKVASGSELWIAQTLVRAKPRMMPLYQDDSWQVRSLYADISAYANLGVQPRPTGGAVRASGSRIVNIQGGGGLQPLITAAVIDALMS